MESSTFRFAPTEWAARHDTDMGKRVSSFILNVLVVDWCKFDRPIFFVPFSRALHFMRNFWTTCRSEQKKRKEKKSFDFSCSLFFHRRLLPHADVATHTHSHARHTNNQSIKIVSVTYNAAYTVLVNGMGFARSGQTRVCYSNKISALHSPK